jgi:hypothetical protein
MTTPVVTWEAYEYRPVEEMRVIGLTDGDDTRSVQPAHGANADIKPQH